MTLKIAYLPGDGIGHEVLAGARTVLEAAADRHQVPFEFVPIKGGGEHYLATGAEWQEGGYEFCRDEAAAVLLGAIGHPEGILPNGDLAGAGVIFGLRFGLDLYANLRPVRLYPNVPHRISGEFRQIWAPENVDMLLIRENTEGAYTPIRGYLDRGGQKEIAVDSRIITYKGAKRVIKMAFEMAEEGGRGPPGREPQVTCIDKSNVMAGCRLFRATYDEVAAAHPSVKQDYAYVDAFTQWLVRDPQVYDVCVVPNMLGDIVTDLAAVLQGGMGMAASGNIGERHGMFEPVHGSAPKHAGKDKANPIAAILSGRMMLEWLGSTQDRADCRNAAASIETAIASYLATGSPVTYDLGGTAKLSEVAQGIADLVAVAGQTA